MVKKSVTRKQGVPPKGGKKTAKKAVKKSVKKKTVAKAKLQKKSDLSTIAYWTPRILIILFTTLISMFSLDVFSEYTGVQMLLALFMHLIPTIILVIFLVIAWKWEKIGGALFLALGAIFGVFFDAFESLGGFMILVLPLWLIGSLFWISAKLNSK